MIGELINHLWQSTAFAFVAGLLAVLLRKNRARIRYGLWLSASLKFLLPLSLLIGLGGRLEWMPADNSFAAQIATPAVSYTMEQVTEPFPDAFPSPSPAPAGTSSIRIANGILLTLFIMWACGFGTILLVRLKASRRIRAAIRESTPLEVQAIGIPARVRVRSYPGQLEPGVVGLWNPVLLLPARIMNRLEPRQLEAVLAHELCHVQRRDNFTAALHMIVETVFWFHPLVWWIGARLVEERERACDEEVLRLGNEPQVYAEAILNVCKFYQESPLVCMPGVSGGSDLRNRLENIMGNCVADKLSFNRAILLISVGVIGLAGPVALGVLHATASRVSAPAAPTAVVEEEQPAVIQIVPQETEQDVRPGQPAGTKAVADGVAGLTGSTATVAAQRGNSPGSPSIAKRLEFEVASVRLLSGGAPNPGARFGCRGNDGVISLESPGPPTNLPEGRCVGEIGLQPLVALAYNHPRRYVSGGTEWSGQPFQLIQINAKAPDPAVSVTMEQLREMLRSLLADRFKLEFHRQQRESQEYLLRVARDGIKFKPASGPEEPPRMVPSGVGPLTIAIRGKSEMGAFARFLTTIVGFPAADQTAISGIHDYSLSLNIVPGQRGGNVGVRGAGGGGGTGNISVTEFDPPISIALQEQLGLRLDREEIAVEMFIIDRAEKPSEN